MSTYAIKLQQAYINCRVAGFDGLADVMAELLRRELDGDDRVSPRPMAYAVLHPTRADRTAFEHVESPKLNVA